MKNKIYYSIFGLLWEIHIMDVQPLNLQQICDVVM